jgi:hypothetical protein
MVEDVRGQANPSCCEHVMRLYQNDEERDKIAVDYINEGLRRGQLAIYASVDAQDPSMLKYGGRIHI